MYTLFCSWWTVVRHLRKGLLRVWVRDRHERDQSFLVPVPVRKKKISSRSGEKKILVPVPAGKSFRSRSQSKIFWSRSCWEKFLVPVVVKKQFGPGGTGTTLPISSQRSIEPSHSDAHPFCATRYYTRLRWIDWLKTVIGFSFVTIKNYFSLGGVFYFNIK